MPNNRQISNFSFMIELIIYFFCKLMIGLFLMHKCIQNFPMKLFNTHLILICVTKMHLYITEIKLLLIMLRYIYHRMPNCSKESNFYTINTYIYISTIYIDFRTYFNVDCGSERYWLLYLITGFGQKNFWVQWVSIKEFGKYIQGIFSQFKLSIFLALASYIYNIFIY